MRRRSGTGLKVVALRGVGWTSIGVFINGVGQLVVLSVLARHLTPAEFGIASAALIIFALGANIFDGGVGLNIAQRNTLGADDSAAAAQISFLLALVLAGVLFSFMEALAVFFESPPLVEALEVVIGTLLLAGATGAQDAIMFHQRRYRTIALVSVLSFLFGYAAVSIVSVLHGAGYMAVVYGQMGVYVVKLPLLLLLVRNPVFVWPGLALLRSHLADTVMFSIARFATFVSNQADKIIVGRMLGIEALGFYGRAHQIMMAPNKIFVQSVVRVVTPLFSSIQDDRARVGRGFLGALLLAIQLVGPAIVVLVVFRQEVVGLLLGPGWDTVAILIAPLAFGGMFQVLYKVPLLVLHAQRLPLNSAVSQSVFASALVVVSILAASQGMQAVALAVASISGLNYLSLTLQVARHLSISILEILQVHLRALLPSLALAVLALSLKAAGGESLGAFTSMFIVSGVGAVLALSAFRKFIRKKV